MTSEGTASVDAHLDQLPEPQRSTLRTVRQRLLSLLPTADEAITYRMPTVMLAGHGIVAYDGFSNHCSLFPMSGAVLVGFDPPEGAAVTSKGTLQFAVDRPLPKSVLRTILSRRLNEFGGNDHGRRIEFYANGIVKAEGAMRRGKQHGSWSWYRADGTLRRTGRFRDGVRIGVWRDFHADGSVINESTANG